MNSIYYSVQKHDYKEKTSVKKIKAAAQGRDNTHVSQYMQCYHTFSHMVGHSSCGFVSYIVLIDQFVCNQM